MILEFLIFCLIITTSTFMSEITVLSNHNWYMNWLTNMVKKIKNPKLSNMVIKIGLSKILTCERCHYHHWIFILLSLTMYFRGYYFYNPFLETLPISLFLWYTYEK